VAQGVGSEFKPTHQKKKKKKKNIKEGGLLNFYKLQAGGQWLIPVILTTLEAEIERIEVPDQTRQII
jgi:hypothetical protein